MINVNNVKKFCCEDISNIENYDKAMSSPEVWHCHHLLETHNSDGERRAVDISHKELIAMNMYYHRPAEELIFLTRSEHRKLHQTGKKYSEETRQKISAANKRRTLSDETKQKISEAHTGKKLSEETKRKISEAKKGSKNALFGKHHSEEAKRKMSEAKKGKPSGRKGKHWKLVDGKRIWY